MYFGCEELTVTYSASGSSIIKNYIDFIKFNLNQDKIENTQPVARKLI